MPDIPDYVQNEARKELARRIFFEYCQRRYPNIYKDDRPFLKELCDGIQGFIEQNKKKFLVVNVPPRHYKSLTGTNLVEWLFGQSIETKVMTGSYNETLSGTFARKVRDTIDEQSSHGVEVYEDLFPDTKIKFGQASKSLWALEGGGSQDNYLATSPTGTATGFGANIIVIDDIIKNKLEAFNRLLLDGHWDWFTNTMLSRTEGDDWKVIIIMTRWAKEDLAGRVIQKYGDLVEVIQFKAVQDDGSMLCEEVLSRSSYEIKTQEMAKEIVEANYNQKPIDIQGRLYDGFMTYDKLPETEDEVITQNYTDTADKGTDFLCSVSYKVFNESDVYITGVYMSDDKMEITEPETANLMDETDVSIADIESNSGGRGFGRNVARLLKEMKNHKVVINDINQTSNKEARILASSAWNQKHIFMPTGWTKKYPEFANQLLTYQKKGKNAHDDAPDVLAGIYEKVANTRKVDYSWKVR